jgi:site-specific DNA-methyltransferase (cytosine-N4-specific)
VLDPFSGAGTTMTEAARGGRKGTAIDLNPIAALITRVKLRRWTADDDLVAWHHASSLGEAAKIGDAASLTWARANIPRIDHWFSPVSQSLLAGAIGYADSIRDPDWRDIVRVAISSVIVRLSRQESDTRYAAVDKHLTAAQGGSLLDAAVRKVATQLAAFAPEHCGGTFNVHEADARTLARFVQPGSVAAAIFSPPYPNAYEYWLYHKYRMYWLGFDPVRVRGQEFGARPHYSGNGRLRADDFARQMLEVLQRVSLALVPRGICLIVIGDSRIQGDLIDNGRLISDVAAAAGLDQLDRTQRLIRPTNRSFNLSVARATHEHVLLFRKP